MKALSSANASHACIASNFRQLRASPIPHAKSDSSRPVYLRNVRFVPSPLPNEVAPIGVTAIFRP